jgi:hypothetical protein
MIIDYDVWCKLAVICRLHNLWSPFQIPFCSAPSNVFSFREHASYYLRTIRRFHGMARKCHIEASRITYFLWTHLWIFHNSKICDFMFKCWILLRPMLGVRTVVCTWQFRTFTGSIKPSLQYFQCCCFGLTLVILMFFFFCDVGLSLGILFFAILELIQYINLPLDRKLYKQYLTSKHYKISLLI